MKTLPDTQYTQHFRRYHFIEGVALPDRAIVMNWNNISEFNEVRYYSLAMFLESVIKLINYEFQAKNSGNWLRLQVNTGFRCRAWELSQGRSGHSQHCIDAAADVVPFTPDLVLAVQILNFLNKIHSPRSGGHAGGFAVKPPTLNPKKKIVSPGFAHYDLRPIPARWTY